MIKLKHYIVVRFNLGLYRLNGRTPAQWFENRITIFNSVSLPSLCNQTNHNFVLVLLVDPEMPKKHWAIISKTLESAPGDFQRIVMSIPLSDDWRPKRYSERWTCEIDYTPFITLIQHDSKAVLQTRLDNDDALMPNAVDLIQQSVSSQSHAYCVDFLKGYVIDTGNKKAFTAHHKKGTPFISLYQPSSEKMKCIYDLTHQKIALVYPCMEFIERMWVMNIHENNVSNRLFPWMIEESVPYDHTIPGCI